MNIHEVAIKVKVDTSEVQEAIERLKKQLKQNVLAQKILDLIERVEHESIVLSEDRTAQAFFDLADDIKELCQEELNKHD